MFSAQRVWLLLLAAFLPACLHGQSLDSYTYVPNSGGNTLSVIDNAANSVIATTTTATGPFQTVASPDGRFVYELDSTSSVSVISTSSYQVVSTINLGLAANNNGSLAITPDGKTLYVVNNLYPNIYAVDTATQAVTAVPVNASPTTATVTPDGSQIYVVYSSGSALSVVNRGTNVVTNYNVPAMTSPNFTAFSSNGAQFYVADDTINGLIIIDTATKQTVATVPTGTFPIGVAVSPNRFDVYVANISSNTLSIVDATTHLVIANIPIPSATAAAVTPGGQTVYVVSLFNNDVFAVNLTTDLVTATIPVGANPFLLSIGPNIIVPGAVPAMAGGDADLTALGFTQFVDFNGGTLQATASFTSGRTVSLLDAGGTIDTNGNNVTLTGAIINQGALTKTGAGILTLTGANTYTGGTILDAGTIAVGGATVLGTGNFSNVGGTLTTANDQRVINVGGTFMQNAPATLLLNVNDAGHDQLAIGGAGVSTFAGTLAANFAGYASTAGLGHVGATQTLTAVSTAGGYTGRFELVTENLAPGASASLIYVPDDVLLDVTQAPGLFITNGLNPNQQAVANYINGGLIQGRANLLINALGDAVTIAPGSFPADLNQLMPLNFHVFASSTAFNNQSFLTERMDNYLAGHRTRDGNLAGLNSLIDSSSLTCDTSGTALGLQTMRSHLLAWNPVGNGLISDVADPVLASMPAQAAIPSAAQINARAWNFFVSGNVVLAQDFSQADSSLAHHDNATGAMEIGADYRFSPHFMAGAFFGYGHTDGSLDELNSTASVDTFSPGLYASYANAGWYANAIGTYGFSSYTQDRNVAIGAFNGTAHSTPNGDQILGDLDGGFDFHRGAWTFGPTGGVQYVHLDVDSYTESGTPGADLLVNRDETDSLRSRLGARASYLFQYGHMLFTPRLDASWQHEFMDQSRGITAQFDGLGAGSFDVRTANPSRDSLLVSLGVDAQLTERVLLYGSYMVQAGQENYFGQSVEAGVKIGF